MASRQTDITVTNKIVEYYEARSYPSEQCDKNGLYNLYKVPVYEIVVSVDGGSVTKKFMAPRFMPYYNDPKNPDKHYSAIGWVNSGLSKARRQVILQYKQDYEVQNRFSPGRGAIVVYKSFYIHAGPADLLDYGFGSAGCIEVIGNFDVFKQTIADFSGVRSDTSDVAIATLVKDRRLIVTLEEAKVPRIATAVTRKVHD
jgi:hypothetical protein